MRARYSYYRVEKGDFFVVKIWKRTRCGVTLFAVGGLSYTIIELLWRGYSHWTMFCLGGVCFRWIGCIAERTRGQRLARRCGLCAAAVTAAEFLCGCVVNLWWGLGIWDYSGLPVNLLGQVCLLYSLLWGVLSLFAMPLYTCLRRALEQPAAVTLSPLPARRRRPAKAAQPTKMAQPASPSQTAQPASPAGSRLL